MYGFAHVRISSNNINRINPFKHLFSCFKWPLYSTARPDLALAGITSGHPHMNLQDGFLKDQFPIEDMAISSHFCSLSLLALHLVLNPQPIAHLLVTKHPPVYYLGS